MDSHPVFEIIANRHCKRAFLEKDVPKDVIEKALDLAGNAASSKNTQPWKVAVLRGKGKDELAEKLCAKFDSGEFEKPDYRYSPDPLPEDMKAKAKDCGIGLFKIKGITREDKAGRIANSRENFRFFGAPAVLFFHLIPQAEKGTFMDLGQYLQSVMLALSAQGISSCPQYSITSYTQSIKSELNLPEENILVCGLPIGYAKEGEIVNNYIPQRMAPSEYTTWHE
ncbi:MAG: nitroreductase [Planctomycetes bacterium]|nr:nitroreductase [Planctomycetota bacterium]